MAPRAVSSYGESMIAERPLARQNPHPLPVQRSVTILGATGSIGASTVALINKECLVCAGALFMRRAAQTGATVLPVDSEHNALFQALGCGRREDVKRVVLTASGGPFRTWSAEAIRNASPEQALRHPNW